MEFFILLLALLLFTGKYESTQEKIKRITTKLSLKQPSVFINISALTILIQDGHDEELILEYSPAISKIIESYKLIHNDDIYNHKNDFLSKFEEARDREAERLASIEEEAIQQAKIFKALKILALPAFIALAFLTNSAIDTINQANTQYQNETNAKAYGMAVRKAFEQAAIDGDSANTVAELSDNFGKVYLSPDLSFQGNRFYISDIEGFESYALLDNTGICGEYSYDYEELVNRVKEYKFEDGCYDGKFFFMVKPVFSKEEIKEKATNNLIEEVNKLRKEIEQLKAK